MTAKRMALYLGSQKVSAHIGSQKVTPATPVSNEINVYLYIEDANSYTGGHCYYNFTQTSSQSQEVSAQTNQNILIATINNTETLYELILDAGSSQYWGRYSKLYISNDGINWGTAYNTFNETGMTYVIGMLGAFQSYEITQTTYFKLSNIKY